MKMRLALLRSRHLYAHAAAAPEYEYLPLGQRKISEERVSSPTLHEAI